MSREFDSHVRATQRNISGNQPEFERSSKSTAVWWVVSALLVALVLGAAVAAFVVLRG